MGEEGALGGLGLSLDYLATETTGGLGVEAEGNGEVVEGVESLVGVAEGEAAGG